MITNMNQPRLLSPRADGPVPDETRKPPPVMVHCRQVGPFL